MRAAQSARNGSPRSPATELTTMDRAPGALLHRGRDDNRRALLDAARRVVGGRGHRMPLSAVAREAGPGQGVLRRFPPGSTCPVLAVPRCTDRRRQLLGLPGSLAPTATGRSSAGAARGTQPSTDVP